MFLIDLCALYCSNDRTLLNKSGSRAKNSCERSCATRDGPLVQCTILPSLYPRYEVYRGYIVFAFSVIMFV